MFGRIVATNFARDCGVEAVLEKKKKVKISILSKVGKGIFQTCISKRFW